MERPQALHQPRYTRRSSFWLRMNVVDADKLTPTPFVPNHSSMQGSVFPLRQFRMRNSRRLISHVIEGACPDARRFKHRSHTDLDLWTDYASDGVGDLNAVARAGLLRLFKLNTDCAKAVHNVLRVVAIESSGTRPFVTRGDDNPRTRNGPLDSPFDFQLQSRRRRSPDADGILTPAMECYRVFELTPDHRFQLRE